MGRPGGAEGAAMKTTGGKRGSKESGNSERSANRRQVLPEDAGKLINNRIWLAWPDYRQDYSKTRK